MAKPYGGPPPILVGYDASDDAVKALEYAARLAAATKTMLDIVYVADDTVVNSAWGVVFDGSDVQSTARRFLQEAIVLARAHGAARKRIRTKVAVGTPVGVLTQLSQSSSLVVVGRRASSGVDRAFSGSTAVGLAATVRCPLVVVSDSATSHEGPIGVAVDVMGSGAAGLDWVLDNPLFVGRSIHVISVVKEPQGRLFRSSVSQDQIDRAVATTTSRQEQIVASARQRHPEGEVTAEVRFGSPVDELAKLSEGLSLLVVEAGIHFPTYTLGGVVRGVMAHAQCPLALVK